MIFKNLHSNIHILLISIATVTWFYAISGIIALITNNSKKNEVYALLKFFALSLLYLDDYSFSELHSKQNTAAAVTSNKSNSA